MKPYLGEFSAETQAAVRAAMIVGEKLLKREWSAKVELKEHPTFGTSSVTEADKEAQKCIIEEISKFFPHALFVGEEGNNEGITPESIKKAPLAYIIDGLDGTTEYAHLLPSWSTSIGIMRNGWHSGGVVFAPAINGGFLMASDATYEVHNGLSITEGEGGESLFMRESQHLEPSKKPIICLGVDVQRLDAYHHFLHALPKNLRPRAVAPSGALGLALVAAGRYDAMVQSPQMPWDWSGGYPCIIEGYDNLTFIGYHVDNDGKIHRGRSGDSCYRTDRQTLGFVAGRTEIANQLFDLLIEHYGQ